MWWTSVPIWCLFLAASLGTPGQANWPAPAYIAGMVLAAAWLREQFAGPSRRFMLIGLFTTVALGLGVSLAARFPQLVRPAIARLAKTPAETDPTPIRKFDPTTRLQGWHALAGEVDGLRERIRRESGEEPELAAMLWKLPGELSFYCRGNPPVHSFGSALFDRHSQFDLWRPNPVADPEAFRGRTFIYVGDPIPNVEAIFDSVDSPMQIVYSEGGIPIATWDVWICRGFRGFPPRRGITCY
ncbi:MAG TPA: hypothetical protein VGL71_06520 [Urbifossiella sp.]|jgi:hypothetical protein